MGSWYTIGLLAGLGVAVGVLAAGLFPRLIAAALGAAAVAVGIGFARFDWDEAIAGAVGGLLGALGATVIVTGALRRGGTRGGTAVLVGLAAVGDGRACLRSGARLPRGGRATSARAAVTSARARAVRRSSHACP